MSKRANLTKRAGKIRRKRAVEAQQAAVNLQMAARVEAEALVVVYRRRRNEEIRIAGPGWYKQAVLQRAVQILEETSG